MHVLLEETPRFPIVDYRLTTMFGVVEYTYRETKQTLTCPDGNVYTYVTTTDAARLLIKDHARLAAQRLVILLGDERCSLR